MAVVRRNAICIGFVLAGFLAACPVLLPLDDGIQYPCRHDRDCRDDQICRNLVCSVLAGSDRGNHPIDATRDNGSVDGAAPDRVAIDQQTPRDAQSGHDLARLDAVPAVDAARLDSGDGTLFSADFSRDPGTFTWADGTWTAGNGVAQQTNTCYVNPDSVVTGADWTDVTVSADLRFDDACPTGLGQAGLMIRVQGTTGCAGNAYYYCVADYYYNDLYIGPLQSACSGSALASANTGSILYGQWYTMRFTAIGNTLRCELSGGNFGQTYVASGVDGLNRFSHGSAGFNLDGAAVSYRNFTVTSAP